MAEFNRKDYRSVQKGTFSVNTITEFNRKDYRFGQKATFSVNTTFVFHKYHELYSKTCTPRHTKVKRNLNKMYFKYFNNNC